MKLPWSKTPTPIIQPVRDQAPVKSELAALLKNQKAFDAALAKSFQRTHADLKIIGADGVAMDEGINTVKAFSGGNSGLLPQHVMEYYSEQGFIGWQMCAILAQNWLINKACKMPGNDAVRHGFERSLNDAEEVDEKEFDRLRQFDKAFKLKNNMIEHFHFARVFGVRHTLFLVDGIDYEAPFNPDGIKPDSYKGMTQIDPYWLAPMFDLEDASNPYSQNFYDPTWWMVQGHKIHRSHFVISRNQNIVADLLKPSYFYGGIPLPQLIYQRVYASERTANEAPLLAMTKRLITLTTDTTKAMANLDDFKNRLQDWVALINNFGVKILGEDEKVEQIDTNLGGLDETIMTQYQLVAAIADVPATKLLGTSPKGFGAAGEYENDSYHEFLESIQENELTPIIDRHTLLCQRSFGIAPNANFEVQWFPVDTPGAKEQAEINTIKAQADSALVDAGAIDGMDVRRRLIMDRDSGYNGIDEEMENPPNEEGEPEGGGDIESNENDDDQMYGENDPTSEHDAPQEIRED